MVFFPHLPPDLPLEVGGIGKAPKKFPFRGSVRVKVGFLMICRCSIRHFPERMQEKEITDRRGGDKKF